jgi:hypothetical protein
MEKSKLGNKKPQVKPPVFGDRDRKVTMRNAVADAINKLVGQLKQKEIEIAPMKRRLAFLRTELARLNRAPGSNKPGPAPKKPGPKPTTKKVAKKAGPKKGTKPSPKAMAALKLYWEKKRAEKAAKAVATPPAAPEANNGNKAA